MAVKNVLKIAVTSRLVVFVLQLLFNLLPDHEADAFYPNSSIPNSTLDFVIRSSLDGFQKWDAKYFVYLSENGYTSENMFAFFPLIPCVGYIFGSFIHGMMSLSMQTACLLACYIANLFFFIGATTSLYNLTQKMFCCDQFSFLVSLLFCFNPASIFFSSCYTESVFSFAVFTGLATLNENHFVLSAFWFLLASASRSNGIINVAFIAYFYLFKVVGKEITFKYMDIIRVIFCCSLIVLPFALFTSYGYHLFCLARTNVNKELWCYDTVPIIYGHIQKKYWQLGLFKYYTLRKIPNFVLSLPVVCITFHSLYKYLKTRFVEIKYLGFPFCKLSRAKIKITNLFYLDSNLFCYFVHLCFLVTFSLLFMHIEVTTRMVMSSSPLIYWVMASYIHRDISDNKPNWSSLTFFSKFLVSYCSSYFLVGILLHVNFLPWT